MIYQFDELKAIELLENYDCNKSFEDLMLRVLEDLDGQEIISNDEKTDKLLDNTIEMILDDNDDDCWVLMKQYQNPNEPNLSQAIDHFKEDIIFVIDNQDYTSIAKE